MLAYTLIYLFIVGLHLFIIFPWLIAKDQIGKELTFNEVFWMSVFWFPYWAVCIVAMIIVMIVMPQDTILASPYYWMKKKYENRVNKFKKGNKDV